MPLDLGGMEMSARQKRKVLYLTLAIFSSAILFFLFIQFNKRPPFREVNPFLEDPYDLIGSFAIQIAALVGLLTFARAIRLSNESAQTTKVALIRRGNVIVLVSIFATLITDTVATIVNGIQQSEWSSILLGELVLMYLISLCCAGGHYMTFTQNKKISPPSNLTPADAIDDLLVLVKKPVEKLRRFSPFGFLENTQDISSDRIFSRVPWLDPRNHYWRFACVVGFAVGFGLAMAHLQEGLPPRLLVIVLVSLFFTVVEFAAVVTGFALFGRILGLRPS